MVRVGELCEMRGRGRHCKPFSRVVCQDAVSQDSKGTVSSAIRAIPGTQYCLFVGFPHFAFFLNMCVAVHLAMLVKKHSVTIRN